MPEGKYKYLLKNVGILTLSSFGSKILSFVLIPLYTSLLTTAEYGVYDIYATTVSLVIPVLTLNVCDAVLRFSLDDKTDSVQVLSIGLKKCIIAGLIFIVLVLFNWYFNLVSVFAVYPQYLCMYMLAYMTYDLISQFARGMEDIKGIAISGVINAVIMLTLNVYFLKVIQIGLVGYFLANCIAYIVPGVYLAVRLSIWKYIVLRGTDRYLKRDMISYSKPLVFNTVAWWINNASDRYIVTLICGVAANGIYSVAYKIPSILNIVQSIFSQAWTLSAVKEYEGKNKSFYKNIYSTYNAGMVLVCSVLIMFDRFLAGILFANEFYEAWRYAPWLMISVVFGSLSGVLGGIFTASKKTKVTAQTTVVGASVNTVLNFMLVYLTGPVGAAIATLISYVLVWISRYREANQIISMGVNIKRDIVSYMILASQATLMQFITSRGTYIFQVVLFVLLLVLYYKDGIQIVKGLLGRR